MATTNAYTLQQWISQFRNMQNTIDNFVSRFAISDGVRCTFLMEESFLSKYQREFEPYKVTVDLSDREQHNYMYNPRLFAYDIYGYPEFWYLVLYANELHSELEFNMKRVHFYNAGIIRILDTIRDLETKYKNENDQEMTDIVVNNESVNANVMGSII